MRLPSAGRDPFSLCRDCAGRGEGNRGGIPQAMYTAGHFPLDQRGSGAWEQSWGVTFQLRSDRLKGGRAVKQKSKQKGWEEVGKEKGIRSPKNTVRKDDRLVLPEDCN